MNQQNAKKYEDQFNSDFAEYEKMKPEIDRVAAVFDSLQKDMKRCKEGTKEFKEIYKSAMNEYKRQVQQGTQPVIQSGRSLRHFFTLKILSHCSEPITEGQFGR